MNKPSSFGDFTIFGCTQNPAIFLQHQVPVRLGVAPRIFQPGPLHALFFYTTYGEVAEDDESLVLKLGFLRSLERTAISAQQLLEQGFAKPDAIDSGRLRGNALMACLGKKEISFSVYKTLLGVPQLYYAPIDGGFICSDRLKCIVHLLDRVDLNEDIIPLHFLFRSTPGDLTYYRQIRRLLPGEFLRFTDGKLSLKIVQDFRFPENSGAAGKSEEDTIESLYKDLGDVVTDYISQVEQKGECLANLLSGGVDSSLLQHLINKHTTNPPARSYSFAVRVPSFSHEIEYAQQASQLFQTRHTFVDIQAEDYPGLISRTIEALAQPPILETEPGMLSIAEFFPLRGGLERYFVSGQGADTVFGLHGDKKLKGLHTFGKIPGARWALRLAGTLLKPFKRVSHMFIKGSEILGSDRDPDTFISPANSVVVYADPGVLRRCFGDQPLLNALRFRRELATRYLDSDHYLEKPHVVDLMTDTYELGVQRQQLFLEHGLEQVHPFFDDDILRAGFAIPAGRRYIKGQQPKYLLKEMLHRKTGAAVSRKPKGFSIWEADLMAWMTTGPLNAAIRAIDLPGFINRADFNRLVKNPDYFLWELLVFDLFRKYLQYTVKG